MNYGPASLAASLRSCRVGGASQVRDEGGGHLVDPLLADAVRPLPTTRAAVSRIPRTVGACTMQKLRATPPRSPGSVGGVGVGVVANLGRDVIAGRREIGRACQRSDVLVKKCCPDLKKCLVVVR